MNERRELRERALRWLQWADEDLALARSAAADTSLVSRGACVWAHQAAEKALKAVLVFADVDPPKTHNLVRLREMSDISLTVTVAELVELSTWSIEGRYPADVRDATATDAALAIAIAVSVLNSVRQLLAADE